MNSSCETLHELFNALPRFGADFDERTIPSDGIYVMFQLGELAHNADRIVRIGTHRGDSRLTSRLREHFHKENKDRSIFRKHIGRALLAQQDDSFLRHWNLDLTTRKSRELYGEVVDERRSEAVEAEVTEFLSRSITFSVIGVHSKQQRLMIEKSLLSTLACCGECGASTQWLGRFHQHSAIQQSGLWNIQGLKGKPLSEDEAKEIRDKFLGGN